MINIGFKTTSCVYFLIGNSVHLKRLLPALYNTYFSVRLTVVIHARKATRNVAYFWGIGSEIFDSKGKRFKRGRYHACAQFRHLK